MRQQTGVTTDASGKKKSSVVPERQGQNVRVEKERDIIVFWQMYGSSSSSALDQVPVVVPVA